MSDGKPIINVTRGTVVCRHAILAERPLQRMRGLLGTDALPAEDGLLLHPAPSIHTAFMRFPIDVVFLDGDSVVVRVVERLAPWRAASAKQARSALELAGGHCARRGVHVGDWLIRVSDDLIWHDAEDRGTVRHRWETAATADRDPDEPAQLAARIAADTGRALSELVLVSRDRRFRAVMAVLLHSRGFAVTLATRLPETPTVGQARAEVVVVDAGDSLATAEREAVEAGLMTPDRVVVFVTDDGEAAASAAHVVPKWVSPELLCDEITAARDALPEDGFGILDSRAVGGGRR